MSTWVGSVNWRVGLGGVESISETHDCLFICGTETPLNESLSEAEVKAKKFYTSCLDVNGTIESLGAQPLLDLVHKEFSGWSPSWDVGAWDFQDTLEKIHAHGMSSFFSFWVGEDEKEPTKNIMQVTFSSS